jgi:hypothetical protein
MFDVKKHLIKVKGGQVSLSTRTFGVPLCPKCQQARKAQAA